MKFSHTFSVDTGDTAITIEASVAAGESSAFGKATIQKSDFENLIDEIPDRFLEKVKAGFASLNAPTAVPEE